MTILQPGSLDYLYDYRIIDHRPYEVYEPCAQYSNQAIYLDCAKQGSAYYMDIPDRYCPSTPDPAYNQNSKTEIKNNAEKVFTSKIFWGALALIPLGILTHAGVKHAKNLFTKIKNADFWKKLNPKNWFKKA